MNFCSFRMIAALIIPGMAVLSTISPATQAAGMDDSPVENAAGAGFTGLERQLVEKYFGKMPAGTNLDATPGTDGDDVGSPPRLTQHDSLPPDLARSGTLPPGLAQRDLPADLEEQLPPAPEGYERQIVGDTAVVLINKSTGQVTDIIKDILIPPADD